MIPYLEARLKEEKRLRAHSFGVSQKDELAAELNTNRNHT